LHHVLGLDDLANAGVRILV
ncbi:ABC transporter transmembrane region family protein, partial [Vibrio parahaemolyticus EKP-028]